MHFLLSGTCSFLFIGTVKFFKRHVHLKLCSPRQHNSSLVYKALGTKDNLITGLVLSLGGYSSGYAFPHCSSLYIGFYTTSTHRLEISSLNIALKNEGACSSLLALFYSLCWGPLLLFESAN